ncbi:MAG: methyltransferase [Gammaproteobacteria bacterium]|jgi:phospholipid N-methyltransferase|nr:methyltransferase [Gammaproteobacteria bacterium]MDP6536088.1 methyltransferase [Gammaproteobacteria bacterium]HAJ76566.1 ribosomal RNA adenine dimethylase [Gammaproteobacteria bacterium]
MTARFKFSDSINLIKNIRTTGTITPSSKILIEQLLGPIDFGSARCIVELGPGNGCVTRTLLKRMAPDCVLICLELNNEFATELNTHGDKRLRVYNACASSIREILDELDIAKVDHVVSSLPLALIDDDVVDNILASVDSNLREGGRFLQYQYSLANYGDMKPFFRDVKLRFTLRNMPPAFVYECIK